MEKMSNNETTNEALLPLGTEEVMNTYMCILEDIDMEIQKVFYEDSTIDALIDKLEAIRNNYDWLDKKFTQGGKIGIRDVYGNILIPAKYDDTNIYLSKFYNLSIQPMMKDGKFGLVKRDGSGEEITEFIYNSMMELNMVDVLFIVTTDEGCGLVAPWGSELIPPRMKTINNPEFGFITFQAQNGKWGMVVFPEEYYEPIYDEIIVDGEDFVKVKYNGEWGFIDEENNFCTDKDDASLNGRSYDWYSDNEYDFCTSREVLTFV